ncbi:ribonuclease Z, partial [Tremellales sp. Uapishka_1]
MTAADAGMSRLAIVGPPDTAHYLSTLRTAVFRDKLAIDLHCHPVESSADVAEQIYTSPNFTVYSVALQPLSLTPITPSPPLTDHDIVSKSFQPTALPRSQLQEWTERIVRDMFRGGQVSSRRPANHPSKNIFFSSDGTISASRLSPAHPLPMPSVAETNTDMVYICQAPPVRGKFDVAKAAALKVPNGPMRGKLVKGEDIEVEDADAPGGKRIVRPEDCLMGGGPGAHLIADPEDYSNNTFFNSAAWNATHLSYLDRSIFPTPFHQKHRRFEAAELPSNSAALVSNHQIKMHPPALAEILPNHEKDVPFSLTEPGDHLNAKNKFAQEMGAYLQATEAARKAVADEPNKVGKPAVGDNIVVTTLGTGSALPSKYRNVSSTHLDIPGLGGVLLDAGEGTLGQLRRRYGPEGLLKLYADLKLVFISHMHADHHLGLSAILEDRFKHGFTSRLYLIAPFPIAMNLQETSSWQKLASDAALENLVFIGNHRLSAPWGRSNFEDMPSPIPSPGQRGSRSPSPTESLSARQKLDRMAVEDTFNGVRRWPTSNVLSTSIGAQKYSLTARKEIMEDLDLKSLHVPVVEHRGLAYGLVIEHTDGWKIVYSGDTKPCDALVRAGKNATLLIHEATLEDDKPEMAEAKGHSTFSQAIDVGKRMDAKYILLNHFSQRYPKLPKLPTVASPSESTNIVSVSFDLMSLRLGDMWKMAHYMDALSLLFAETEVEDGDETIDAVAADLNPTVDKANVSADKKAKSVKPPGSPKRKSSALVGGGKPASAYKGYQDRKAALAAGKTTLAGPTPMSNGELKEAVATSAEDPATVVENSMVEAEVLTAEKGAKRSSSSPISITESKKQKIAHGVPSAKQDVVMSFETISNFIGEIKEGYQVDEESGAKVVDSRSRSPSPTRNALGLLPPDPTSKRQLKKQKHRDFIMKREAKLSQQSAEKSKQSGEVILPMEDGAEGEGKGEDVKDTQIDIERGGAEGLPAAEQTVEKKT